MLTLFIVSIGVFFISLTGWTLTTYFVKQDSQPLISEELKNLFNICQKFLLSLKNLIEILASNSFPSDASKENAIAENGLDESEQALSVVQPVKEIEAPSLEMKNEEGDDTALSSFSPEVVAVINEEEDKVA